MPSTETFADRVIAFNRGLAFRSRLPQGVRVMNPFRESEEANRGLSGLSEAFYRKFYSDNRTRKIILGINPGRLGAGATGVPFTDTKRMAAACGIGVPSFSTHEPSSVFVYEVIERYGGVKKFFSDFYINSVCPLGFVRDGPNGNAVNCNYYDADALFTTVRPFILEKLRLQAGLGVDGSVCFSLGRKNASFLEQLNREMGLFGRIVALDHPRFIVQYRQKEKERYILQYLEALTA